MSTNSLQAIASITIPADPAFLSVSRQALVGAAEGLGMPDEDLDDLKLVLSEICANAIVHAYGQRGDGEIEVSFSRSPTELEITVADRGRGFPDGRVPAGAGAGLTLLDRLCTRYSIDPRRLDGGATVTFARSIIS
ncbi:MAG TPA: ATP-binding protein [Gaiellales bacterium]|jgi:anti-sigma regulatory factor (Ser/Thr protein kinase)